MSETKVDDMLIEMIEPKIKEIEQRFSDGEGLTQDDINTLLLKSQYNHINHLDDKLNEVTASVIGLEGKFNILEGGFNTLEGKFELLKTDIESKFDILEGKFELLKTDLESKFELLKTDLEGKFDLLKTDIEVTIQKALNKNMLVLVAAMGFFLTLSKLIDKF
ncbi:tRNA-guanine transglycosylase [uncultured Candidatus Thioglobus sp.]|nr:tRNA-guanine transglycosylase [uncultured Candidatus Thioglobus sp.]